MHPAINTLLPEATKSPPTLACPGCAELLAARPDHSLPRSHPPSRTQRLGGLTQSGGHEILDFDFVSILAQILFFPRNLTLLVTLLNCDSVNNTHYVSIFPHWMNPKPFF